MEIKRHGGDYEKETVVEDSGGLRKYFYMGHHLYLSPNYNKGLVKSLNFFFKTRYMKGN